MRIFLFQSPKFTGELAFTFSPDGILATIDNRSNITPRHLHWLLENVPVELPGFLEFTKGGIPIVEQPADLSFDAFWAAWPGAVANRARALQLWNKMSKEHKSYCLHGLPAYRRYISRNKAWYNAKWPDGYLTKELWKNDWNLINT